MNAATTSKVSRKVRAHGTFDFEQAGFDAWMRNSRAELVTEVCQIYAGTDGKGDCPSHWRGYSKEDLAAICADSLGFQD